MSTGQLPYTISEGRPPLRNTSSEAGAPPSEVRIENDSDRKSSKSKFFKVFLETTFVHVSCYPDHYEPKIFFSVFKGHTYASIHDFGLEGSPCNAISEGRPSLRNTSSEAPEARKLRLQRYVSRMYLQSELTEGCKFDSFHLLNTCRKRDIWPADFMENTQTWSSDLKENAQIWSSDLKENAQIWSSDLKENARFFAED